MARCEYQQFGECTNPQVKALIEVVTGGKPTTLHTGGVKCVIDAIEDRQLPTGSTRWEAVSVILDGGCPGSKVEQKLTI